jgi:hypothetical protein
MLVRIEVEFDDTTVTIQQQDLLTYGGSTVCSGAAVLAMGRCAGRMIAALGAGGDVPVGVMVQEFYDAVLRAANVSRPEAVGGGSLPGFRSS